MQSAVSTSGRGLEDDDEQDHERPSKKSRSSGSDPSTTGLREVGLMRKDAGDNYASFLGSASGIHFIRSVYTAVANKQNVAQPYETPDSNLVPGEDDRLHPEGDLSFETHLWNSHEVFHADDQYHFTFDEMISWSKSYFDNWHPAYPFLHAPTVLEMFEKLSNKEDAGSDPNRKAFEMAIVKSILSISLADQRQCSDVARPLPEFLVFQSFKHATDSIDLVLSTKTSMLSLQAVICVQLFLVSMLRHNAASRLGGLITRMVFHLGLHRCPFRYSAFGQSEIQLRQRVFWSVYCIDRHICQSLGLPLTLRDDDIDVCFLNEEVHTRKTISVFPFDDRLQLLNLLAKHAQVKGLILEHLHKSIPYRQSYNNTAAHIQHKLAQWSNDVDAFLDSDADQPKKLSPLHQMMLSVLKQECIIALNRPLLAASKKDPVYQAALQTCVGASRSVITTMSVFVTDPTDSLLGAQPPGRTPLLWPSFTWSVWMSAFILIYAAIEKKLPDQIALRLTHRSLAILGHLSTRGSVWPSACEVAIRELRSRLRKHDWSSSVFSAFSMPHDPSNKPPSADETQEKDFSFSVPSQNLPQEDDSPVYMMREENANAQQETRLGQTNRNTASSHRPSFQQSTSNDVANDKNGQRQQGAPSFMLHQQSMRSTSHPHQHLSEEAHKQPDEHQQVSWLGNMALPQAETVDIFQGFEIPFWLGDDQYVNLINS